MTGRIVSLFASPHQKALELMPWFVAGSLAAEEQQAVEGHLAGCAACQRELQWQRELQSAYVKSAVQPDIERALAKLRPRLVQSGPPPTVLRFGRLGAAPRWMAIALVAQAAVIIGLAALVAVDRERLPGYHLLGATPAADDHPASIVVVFDPEVREREVQRMLRAAGARIVDGPTAGNGYLLRVAPERRDAALDLLRAAHEVLIAEPLDSGSRR
jgi:anti-sigma-K factor RskA